MMRRWFAVLAILVTLLTSYPIYAQDSESLSSVSIEIRPEYDHPAVLVIYHILLSPASSLPATVNLRIPAGAEINAVAISDPLKGLVNTPYDRTVKGPWATLKITTNNLDLQVEYYDVLEKNGTSRHIVFEWPGDYQVDGFTIAIQQPVGSTNFVTNPMLINNSVDQNGFTYFASSTESLPAGQTYSLTIDYQKPTDALSITGFPVQPIQTLSTTTPGRITVGGFMPWVFAGIGAILILVGLAGGFTIWRRGTYFITASSRSRSHLVSKEESNLVYCPKCGKRAQPGDAFCRTCGTRIEREE